MNEICEILTRTGMADLPNILSKIINTSMLTERSHAIGAQPYERSENRLGYANGFKPKTLQTRMGALSLNVPQTRHMEFYPKSIEKGMRSEKALKSAIATMYIQGVSTRKVTKVVEELCGSEVTSMQVSRLVEELDVELKKWRDRPIGSMRYLFLDARYEKVRFEGSVRDLAVLWAIGVTNNGHREILGLSVSLSESTIHWRTFLQTLQTRGMKDVQLIVSDDHAGLGAARKSIFGGTPWQRCQFHLAQNAQHYAGSAQQKLNIGVDLRDIFNAPNKKLAMTRLQETVIKYSKGSPKLSQWLEGNIIEGLTVFDFPEDHQKKIRTSNIMERGNREIRRRTRVATLFPNEDSCLRLVSAVLIELHEEWSTSKEFLNLKPKPIEKEGSGI